MLQTGSMNECDCDSFAWILQLHNVAIQAFYFSSQIAAGGPAIFRAQAVMSGTECAIRDAPIWKVDQKNRNMLIVWGKKLLYLCA